MVELKGITETGNVSAICQVMILDPSIVYVINQREPKQKIVVLNSNISGSEFYVMRNGKISNANLKGLEINGVNISDMKIRNAGAKEGPVTFENLNIPNSKIFDSNLPNVDVSNCNIEGLRINGVLIEELLKNSEKK